MRWIIDINRGAHQGWDIFTSSGLSQSTRQRTAHLEFYFPLTGCPREFPNNGKEIKNQKILWHIRRFRDAGSRVQFLSFSCSFRKKIGQIIGWRPHLDSWRPSSRLGNLGSATVWGLCIIGGSSELPMWLTGCFWSLFLEGGGELCAYTWVTCGSRAW